MTTERKTRNWSELRKTLAKSEPPELIDLVKELYEASPTNRDFLHGRVALVNPSEWVPLAKVRP